MRAVRVHEHGDSSALVVEDIPRPDPGPGEVLIQVEAAGLNFIEIYQREGLYPMQRPYVVGTEAGGRVVAVGDGVAGIAVGDRVVTESARGAYAEFALAPAEKVVGIPDGIDTSTAVAVWLQGLTAHYLAVSTFPIAKGHRCLVHAAAGGVGLLLCQIARMRGAFVIGTASTDEKRALAREAGASETIDYRTADVAASVRAITDGRGVDVVYDSVGQSTYEASLDSLRPRGMIVFFGQSSGKVPPIDPLLLNRKGSLFMTRPTLAHYVATRDELLSRASDLFSWIASGALHVRVGSEFPLAGAAHAHDALQRRETTGKTLIRP
jgi:NADPH2:quinone reductase